MISSKYAWKKEARFYWLDFHNNLTRLNHQAISLLTNAWARGTVRRIFSIRKLYVAGALKCKQDWVTFRSIIDSISSLFFWGITYLHKPKGILWNSHNPRFVLNAVLCLSFSLIGTVWNAPALEQNISSGYLWSIINRLELTNYRHFLPVEQSKTFATSQPREVISNITDGMIPFFGPGIEPIKKRHNCLICVLPDRN